MLEYVETLGNRTTDVNDQLLYIRAFANRVKAYFRNNDINLVAQQRQHQAELQRTLTVSDHIDELANSVTLNSLLEDARKIKELKHLANGSSTEAPTRRKRAAISMANMIISYTIKQLLRAELANNTRKTNTETAVRTKRSASTILSLTRAWRQAEQALNKQPSLTVSKNFTDSFTARNASSMHTMTEDEVVRAMCSVPSVVASNQRCRAYWQKEMNETDYNIHTDLQVQRFTEANITYPADFEKALENYAHRYARTTIFTQPEVLIGLVLLGVLLTACCARVGLVYLGFSVVGLIADCKRSPRRTLDRTANLVV